MSLEEWRGLIHPRLAIVRTHQIGEFEAMSLDLFSSPLTPVPAGLTGATLDRADAMRRDESAIRSALEDTRARWVVFEDSKPLIVEGELAWTTRDAIEQAIDGVDLTESVFLGLEAGAPRFAATAITKELTGELRDARGAAMRLSSGQGAVLAQARSLLEWHERHRFCGRCGAKTLWAKAGHSRRCTECTLEHFPRVDPVVIMLPVDGDQALLGRQPRFPPGFLSALAGFVEHGESLEEAVRREVFEEAGIETGRVAYVASQPWPFSYSLMIGAFAEATSTDIEIDEHELEEARWFTRSEVADALEGRGDLRVPPPFALAHTLLQTWIGS